MRLDKWLWAARFYKTRSLASDDIAKGRVQVNQVVAKASREVKPGDVISLRLGQQVRTVTALLVSAERVAPAIAQTRYSESAESLAQRQAAAEFRRQGTEPALSLPQGRPTKRQRRDLSEASNKGWGSRWSASIDG